MPAVSTTDAGRPVRVKLNAISGLTMMGITDWAHKALAPPCGVRSDGLIYGAGVINAGYANPFVIASGRKRRDMSQFN